jgi:steroid delta-isomerase-like uncharacterized protein
MRSSAEVARAFFERVWNGRELDLLDEIVAPDCVTHQLRSATGDTPGIKRGPPELREHIRAWLDAFPDLQWHIDAMVEDESCVVSWVTATGTHRGPWQGVPATGRAVTIRGAVMQRMADGHIAEDWVVLETLGVYQQLGLVAPTQELLKRR